MHYGGPGSWPGRLFGACCTLLAAVLALRWTVIIITEIWQQLVVIGVVVCLLVGAAFGLVTLVRMWRYRQGGW